MKDSKRVRSWGCSGWRQPAPGPLGGDVWPRLWLAQKLGGECGVQERTTAPPHTWGCWALPLTVLGQGNGCWGEPWGAVGRRGVEPGKPFPAARIRMGGQEVESHFWLRYEHLPYCEVQG